jgi:hypothetical protein
MRKILIADNTHFSFHEFIPPLYRQIQKNSRSFLLYSTEMPYRDQPIPWVPILSFSFPCRQSTLKFLSGQVSPQDPAGPGSRFGERDT